MAKQIEKDKAIRLRKSGTSIKDIAKVLGVSQSTVSLWCRDITLTEMAIKKIARNSIKKNTLGILRYTESLRKQRQINLLEDQMKGVKRIGELNGRDIFCVGIGLYWGEGYKKGNQEFGFTNSDPGMIRFYIKWLQYAFNIQKEDLILRVSINESHKARIGQVQTYWKDQTGIPLHQFTAPSLIKTNVKKVYQNKLVHFGTLRIKVRRGTRQRREILGIINHIAQYAQL